MKIPIHNIESFSGQTNPKIRKVETIKRRNYFVENKHVDGDAPKKFIGLYDYSKMCHKKRTNRNSWIRYIAKTGHKWYPSESITEYLLNRLGLIFGLDVAESRLALIGGQLRFLSRYFLDNSNQELVHGADIIAGYLNESTSFVEEVDAQKLTRDFFTFQLIEKAVESTFPKEKSDIMHELSKLMIFDALVGNNDRHFFNWGVIRNVIGNEFPRFSPVYDTARGLFWNYSESKLSAIAKNSRTINDVIKKYCDNSRPKIGWDGEKNINHFRLFRKITENEFYISKKEINGLFTPLLLERMLNEIHVNFGELMSNNRILLVCKCIEYRFNEIIKLL